MSAITGVYAREILDSRGNPTVEVECSSSPAPGAARRCRPAPPPASARRSSCATATASATAARACSRPSRNVEETIAPEIDGMEASEQAAIDQALLELDGTPNKSALGANAILGVSLAVARAAADDAGLPLYAYLGGVGRAPAAGADDERHQRRRARRQRPRLPGVHARAGRRRLASPKRCAWASRSSTRSRTS